MPSALSSRNLSFWRHWAFQGSAPTPPPVVTEQARTHPSAAHQLDGPLGHGCGGLRPPTLPAWCLAQPWVGDAPRNMALSSATGRPGWAAWGGASRRAPQSPLYIHSPPRDPGQLASSTGRALPLLPLPSITPCQPLSVPPLHGGLFCSILSPPPPHSLSPASPLLSSPLCNPLFFLSPSPSPPSFLLPGLKIINFLGSSSSC